MPDRQPCDRAPHSVHPPEVKFHCNFKIKIKIPYLDRNLRHAGNEELVVSSAMACSPVIGPRTVPIPRNWLQLELNFTIRALKSLHN